MVVSDDAFNRTRSDRVVVVPMTTAFRGIPLHIQVNPPEGNIIRETSYIKCEDIRSISEERLVVRWGSTLSDNDGSGGQDDQNSAEVVTESSS